MSDDSGDIARRKRRQAIFDQFRAAADFVEEIWERY
jgi:hypothetical protein